MSFAVFDPRAWFDSELSGLGWFDPILGTETGTSAASVAPARTIHVVGARQHRRMPRPSRARKHGSTPGGVLFLRSTGSAIASGSGVSAGDSIATGAGAAIASGAGASESLSLAQASGAAIASGQGASNAPSAATGAGAAIGTGTGASVAPSLAAGAGSSTAAGSGASAGVSLATGVGIAIVPSSRSGLIRIVKHGRPRSAPRRHVTTLATILVNTGGTTVAGNGASLGGSQACAVGMAIITGAGTSASSTSVAASAMAIASGTGTAETFGWSAGAGSSTAQGAGFSLALSTAAGTASSQTPAGSGSSLGGSIATGAGSSVAAGAGAAVSITAAAAVGGRTAGGDGVALSGTAATASGASTISGAGSSLSLGVALGRASNIVGRSGMSISLGYALGSEAIIEPITDPTTATATSVQTYADQLDSDGARMLVTTITFSQYETGPIEVQISDADGNVIDPATVVAPKIVVRAKHGRLVVDHADAGKTATAFVWNRLDPEVLRAGDFVLQIQGTVNSKPALLPTGGIPVHITPAVAALA